MAPRDRSPGELGGEPLAKTGWQSESISRILVLGALPLVAMTSDLREALVGGVAVAAVLIIARILESIFRSILPWSELLSRVTAAATSASLVTWGVLAVAGPVGNLSFYLPVLALSGLLVHREEGKYSAAEMVMHSVGLVMVLFPAMVLLGAVREFVGASNVFPLLATGPGALILLGASVGAVRWAEQSERRRREAGETVAEAGEPASTAGGR